MLLTLIFAIVFNLLVAPSSLAKGDELPNEDIITVINDIKREMKKMQAHSHIQDARENATQQAVKLLIDQNTHLKVLINELREDARGNKNVIKDVSKEVQHILNDFKVHSGFVDKKIGELAGDVQEVRKIVQKTKAEVDTITDVLTSPLPGKTWRKPSESCHWLNERFFNLPNGKYWTDINGRPSYQQCVMNNAGIPPVRCSSNPCHADALCEDTDVDVKCTCHCGYVGDGKNCKKSFKAVRNGTGTMLLTTACALRSNTHLTTFRKMGPEYLVRFDVYPRVFEQTNAYNIIHFTTGEDCCAAGSRIPAVWFRDFGDRLILISAVNGDGNFFLTKADTAVALKHWATVEVKQKKVDGKHLIYSIAINNREVFSVVNKVPQEFQNIKVFVADGWFPVHQGFIRNLYVEGYIL